MFAEIAPQYDLLNRTLSFGVDRSWRKRTVRALDLAPGARLLDLCCGTGDLAVAFAVAGASVVGADFTGPMLPLARAKGEQLGLRIAWLRADAQALPLPTASFDAVTAAFGIRNVEDPRQALRESLRVLRPGGRLAILEFFPIRNRFWRGFFNFYFHRVLPQFARFTRAGRTPAYRYLPQSVAAFAEIEAFRSWMEAAGFEDVADRPFTGGVARLVVGRRPGSAGAG